MTPEQTKRLDVIENCPEKATHTDCPGGYIAWHEWAETKSKTHKQVRCKGCNRLTIWVKK